MSSPSEDTTGTGLYFAYGSNLDPAQMEHRCPGAEPAGIAVLDGWGFRIGRRGFATIVPAEDAATWGGLWTVTAAHLASLDRFEGVASGNYRRETFTVRREGAEVDAVVYVEDFVGPGAPTSAYLGRILAGAQWFGLPESYRATLAELAR